MIPRPYRLGPTVPLILIPLVTMTAMFLYQWVKHVFWPNMTLWDSHVQTNIFLTAVATIGGYLLCRYLEVRTLLASIVESSDDAIIGSTLDGIILTWNKGAEKIYGYRAAEVIGKPVSPLLAPDRPEDVAGILERIGKGEQLEHYETIRLRKDGKKIYVNLTVSPILNATGKIIGASSVVREITARKEAELALRETEARLQRTQAFSLVMVAHVGLDGRWLKVPSSLCELFGYTEEEMLARSFPDSTHPEDLEVERSHCRDLIEGRMKSVDFEKRCISRDGRIIWVYLNYSIVTDAEGRPLHFLVYIRDITKRKTAEQELQVYQTQLEELVQSRTAALTEANRQLQIEIVERERAEQSLRESSDKLKLFAYSIVHDLKSPSIGIHGLTRRLREAYGDALDSKGKLYCDQILKASEHVADLVEKINLYVTAKEAPLKVEGFALKEVVSTVRNEFSDRIGENGIQWVESVPDTEIRADRLSVLRVLRNFVDNALKYGGEQLSEVRLGYSQSEEYHVLSVGDDGVGIEREDRDKIFEVFQRTIASRGVSGTGLGLAIVKELAERHGGAVWVEPSPGSGKTFFMSISKAA